MKAFKSIFSIVVFAFALHANAAFHFSGRAGGIEKLSDGELLERVQDEIHHYAPSDEEYVSPLHDYFLNQLQTLKKAGQPQRDDLLKIRQEFFQYQNAYRKLSYRIEYLSSMAPSLTGQALIDEELRLVQKFIELQKLKLNDDQLMQMARRLKKEYSSETNGDTATQTAASVEKRREILERAFVLPELLSQAGAQSRHYGSAAIGIALLSTGGGGIAGLLGGLVYGIATSHGVLGTFGTTAAGTALGIGAGALFTHYATLQPKDVREYMRKARKLERFGESWVPFKKQNSCTQLLATLVP